MVLSIRLSLQWPPEPASEETDTIVLSTPKGHFVDLRPLKSIYSDNHAKNATFESDQWDWAVNGREEVIEQPNKDIDEIVFHHELDSNDVVELIKYKRNGSKGPKPQLSGPDRGYFSDMGNGDRKETGVLYNAETGKVQDYIETWRSLDPVTATMTERTRETRDPDAELCYALKVTGSLRYVGKLVRVGNWVQAMVHDTEVDDSPLHIIRAVLDEKSSKWVTSISIGTIEFPTSFAGKEGDSFKHGELEWECVESSY